MSTTVNITSSYAGKELQEILTPMFEGMKEVVDGDVTLHNDVDFKKALRRMQVSDDILGASTVLFTPTGTVDIDEKSLEPQLREVNLQLAKDDFRSEWAGQRMGKGQLTKTMASEINVAVTKNILGMVGKGLRAQMWTAEVGSAQGQLPVGGIYRQISNAFIATATGSDRERPGYIDNVTVTDANVLDVLAGVIGSVKDGVLDYGEGRLFVAPSVWNAYVVAIGNQSNMRSSVEKLEQMYAGYKIVIVKELAANTVIYANKGNIHFGTDIFSDFASVEILDLSHTTGDRVLRYIQKLAIDVKVGYCSEISIHADGINETTVGVEA